MISFNQIDINAASNCLASIGEVNIFQTIPWLEYVAQMQSAEPIVVSVKCDGVVKGYFSGLIVNKFGLRILGSPFRGWMTYFMGFNLMPDVSRNEILQAFPEFVFQNLQCHYFEIMDPCLEYSQVSDLSYQLDHLPWFAIDLTPSEDQIFSNMKDSGRRGIRKAIKNGLTVEEASDIGFAEEYYAQYQEVMAKRSLKPTYGLEDVRALIEKVYPTGSLLMLRTKNQEGVCIATGIFVFLNRTAIFWGGASWQEYQSLRPNDLLMWHAMKAVKKQGATVIHLGGEAEQFKLKLGARDAKLYRLKKAKNVFFQLPIQIASSLNNPTYKNWVLRRL